VFAEENITQIKNKETAMDDDSTICVSDSDTGEYYSRKRGSGQNRPIGFVRCLFQGLFVRHQNGVRSPFTNFVQHPNKQSMYSKSDAAVVVTSAPRCARRQDITEFFV
jgi:hypothetical protein